MLINFVRFREIWYFSLITTKILRYGLDVKIGQKNSSCVFEKRCFTTDVSYVSRKLLIYVTKKRSTVSTKIMIKKKGKKGTYASL